MSEPFRSLFTVALGAWIGAVAVAILATALLFRRHGPASAWPPCRTLLPPPGLAGTWPGPLVALAVTASLYDRAVLMPSLDAAFKRMQADDDPKWEEEWRFLWAMARWGRTATLAAAAGAAVLGLAA